MPKEKKLTSKNNEVDLSKVQLVKDYYFDGSYDGEVYNLYKIAEDQKADFSFRRNCFCEVHWEQSSACSEPKASSDNTSSD